MRYVVLAAVAIIGHYGAAAGQEAALAPPRGIDHSPAARLASELMPLWECVSGAREAFCIRGTVQIEGAPRTPAGPAADGNESPQHSRETPPGAGSSKKSKKDRKREQKLARPKSGQPSQTIDVCFTRHAFDSFTLSVAHPDYAFEIRRRPEATAVALPRHGVVYVGSGDIQPEDSLNPTGLVRRLISADSAVAVALPFLTQPTPALAAGFATAAIGLAPAADGSWHNGDSMVLRINGSGTGWVGRLGAVSADFTLGAAEIATAAGHWPDLERRDIPRKELEKMIVCGVRRGFELIAPGAALLAPEETPREVRNGQLRWVGGQRVVTLWGTPEEIGTAHGELLATESGRCMDSVLHVVGLAELARTGKWFPDRLAAAHDRLATHIPARHVRETRALANAMQVDPDVLEIVNVFPELFHCSGFAVTGPATDDGTLYHGRVLDYMTRIGLQDSAVIFVIAPQGMIPFTTVGYAGFIGSVSGMNERGISLGEMGGQGEGDWDGVPMATLMRRALEECETLDDVIDLWRRSPRTCEYYYVFADGKSRRAVGVAATPTSLEVVNLGDPHPSLGPGIPGAVVLSKDERLACLRQRIDDAHGVIDEAAAIRLMDRPVAAASNLHNVLFVPERLVFHVANASHSAPAADCTSVRHDLRELLDSIPRPRDDASYRPRLDNSLTSRGSVPGLLLGGMLHAEESPEATVVFPPGLDGVMRSRIPGIVVTPPGTVLAYCEARRNSRKDWGEIEIRLRRSMDGGQTWLPAQHIAHHGERIEGNPHKKVGGEFEQTVNNPVAIVDHDTGAVEFLYCVNYARCFSIRSTDDGISWSKPVEITEAFEPFRKHYDWKVIATGPGHGIQLAGGRMVVPVWLAYGGIGDHGPSAAATIFSDDHGRTWQAGDVVMPNEGELVSPNESMLAPLSDGRVMMVSRSLSGPNRKLVAFSADGATKWTTPVFHPSLWEPRCMASLLAHPAGFLLFSNPHTLPLNEDGAEIPGGKGKRENLSLKISRDDGRTWPVTKTLHAGPSAYSDLAALPDGTILCLFEAGESIDCLRISPDWITVP